MAKLRFTFDEEEEKIGWSQRTRGIGELPKYKPISAKLKFTADVGIGVKAVGSAILPKPKSVEEINKERLLQKFKTEIPSSQFGISDVTTPEKLSGIEKGIIGLFGTWEAKKRAMPELQNVEDFGNEVFRQGDRRNQIAYIHESLTGISKEKTLAEMESNFQKFKNINPDIDKRTWKEYYKQEGLWKTLITGPTKGKYDEAIKLHNQLIDIATKVAEPGKDFIGQLGWSGLVFMMGIQGVNALYNAGLHVKEKMVTGDKLKLAVERIQKAYIPKTGKFKSSLSNNDLAIACRLRDIYRATGGKIENLQIVKDWGVTEKGFKVSQVTLYGGLPADEIVKSLVKTGKLTADIAKELSLAKPELVTQVIQNLSIASPAIASRLAGELVKLVSQKEILKKVEPEIKEEIPKVKIKEIAIENIEFQSPSVKIGVEGSVGRVAAIKEILKTKIPIPENICIENKWSLYYTTPEAVKDITKPLEAEWSEKDKKFKVTEGNHRLLAYQQLGIEEIPIIIKGGKVIEPIPKTEPKPPTIPKALEPLAEEVRKAKDVEDFIESQGKPLYHGTVGEFKDFKDFDISKAGTIKPSDWGKGIYLDPNKAGADYYRGEAVQGTDKKANRLYEELENKAKEMGTSPMMSAIDLGYRSDKYNELMEYDKRWRDRLKELEKDKGKGRIVEVYIDPKAKVYKHIYEPGMITDQFLTDTAKQDGYDVVEIWDRDPDTKEKWITEVIVVNPEVIKTKAQLADFYTQATAKPAEKIEPKIEVKPEVVKAEPKIDLATPAQIKKAHVIANSKALISEKGKMKPQYRKIAEVFTGKRSIKDMTLEEAEMFIDQLDRLPEPKYKAGKLVPPSIPRTMKLTTLDFFKRKYGEPTPVWLLEDQTYYATQLGIHPLVEPFERGKQEFDLEFRQSSNLVDRVVNKLNKIAKTPSFERIRSKVKNIPTKAESKMAKLVNKHETTPPGLTKKEEDVFKYFRNLGKDIWRRENEVREKVDLPPIKYKTAYFRHTADAMAKEMLEGKYPFPQGIKYWGEKMVGKKIFNPMEFHRKLSDDLIDLWSKDIRAVTKAMLWSGLKEIYLAQPAKFLNEQLNAISKDLPEYKNLSPRDQAAYDQTRVIPASTKKWLIDYINQVLKGQETELDASLNRIVTKSGLKGIFDKVLSPFGRSIGRKPITSIFMLSGRAVISGVMGWVPRQIMRNSFQPVQNLALYGLKATIKAYLPASIDKNLVDLLSESLFLKSYTGYEELPTNLMAKLEKVWLMPYGIVAVNNAKLGMKAAYWNILELIKNPKFKGNGWADPQRNKDTPKGFLYPSEKEKLSREMEFGASATQYQYIPIGMPGVFRYKALVPLTRLQSWWMNYFTKFLREAIYRGLKGRPSWAGEDGPTFPWSRRVNFLKYVIIGGAILTALGYKRSFMLGVAPTYLSPAGQLALGIYNYAVADEDWKKKKALKQIYYSWKAFIPGSLAWRDFLAVWKGEKDLEEILFYGKKEKKKVQPPLKITIPESGELQFTEPELKIESDKLKFTF